jgi:chromodomain-helicase-DNA-binding protein 7
MLSTAVSVSQQHPTLTLQNATTQAHAPQTIDHSFSSSTSVTSSAPLKTTAVTTVTPTAANTKSTKQTLSSAPPFSPLPLSARARRALDDAEYTFDPSEGGADDDEEEDGDSSVSSSQSQFQRRSSARLQSAATLKTVAQLAALNNPDNDNEDEGNNDGENESDNAEGDDERATTTSAARTGASPPSVRELHRHLLASRLNEAEMEPDVVDKILDHRWRDKTQEGKIPEDGTSLDAFEYLVKWKGKSYIHVAWVSPDVIRQEGQGGRAKLYKYWKRRNKLRRTLQSVNEEAQDNKDNFPSDYLEVDRILAYEDVIIKKKDGTSQATRMYLVKWCALPYLEATWETAEDIKDDQKIKDFFRFNTPLPPPQSQKTNSATFQPYRESLVYRNDNQLRPYQLEGLNWLIFCWHQRRGCLLADEMGLGKTVQAITFLEHLLRVEGVRGPFLVVVPLSTLPHWQREIEGWTELNVVLYQGNKLNRQAIREYEWFYPGTQTLKFHILLTTYEMLLAEDWTELAKIVWRVAIIDEAQRLKNNNSKLLQHLRQLQLEHRILLTGTPIQNNTSELWTLLNFIEPLKFSSHEQFLQEFGTLQDATQVENLHKLLRPYLLRRSRLCRHWSIVFYLLFFVSLWRIRCVSCTD